MKKLLFVLLTLTACSKKDAPAPVPQKTCGEVVGRYFDQGQIKYYITSSLSTRPVEVKYQDYAYYGLGDQICFDANNNLVR